MARRTASSPDAPALQAKRNYPAIAACAVIILAGLAAYSNSFHGPFIFDDRAFVTQPNAKSLWPIGPVLAAQRPVPQATFALNYMLARNERGTAGGADEPDVMGYHLFNLTVHLLAALALFGVVRRTLRLPTLAERFSENAATALAFCTALLWALHPLQTAAVTYIIQRMESLMGLFYLLTLYCFVRAVSSAHPRPWYAASVASCLLGMGSKEVMISAPLAVLLYDRAFVAGSFREALRQRWGLYVGLAATWLLLLRGIIGAFSPHAETAGFTVQGITPLLYAQSQFGVILHYLRLAFWPSGLCLDYAWPLARTPGEILPGALLVGSLLIITVWLLVRWKQWGFVGALFFLVLAPSSSIMPLSDLAFEHRMYLPLATIVVAVVFGACAAGRSLIPEQTGRLPAYAAVAALVLVAGSLGRLTHLRNMDYRTEVGIWEDTARKRPRNPHAWANLADACLRHGDYGDKVIEYCDKAIALLPDFAEAWNDRGATYASRHRYEEAIRDYTKVISLKENFPLAYCNRAQAHFMMNDFAAAIPDYDRAIELKPDYAEAYLGRAFARAMMRDFDGAIQDYGQSIALQPCFDAYCNRGTTYANLGRADEAIRDFNSALALDPNSAMVWCNRGNVYFKQSRWAEALHDYDQAIALRPDYGAAYQNRAMLYYTLKDFASAQADAKMCEKLGQAAERPK